MPKYGGMGGQGGAVFFEVKEEHSLRKVLKQFPLKKIIAGKYLNHTGSCPRRHLFKTEVKTPLLNLEISIKLRNLFDHLKFC